MQARQHPETVLEPAVRHRFLVLCPPPSPPCQNTEGGDDGPGDNGSSLGADEAKSKNDGLSKQILSLAIPALVALSVDPLMSAVDTAYIGRLGADLGGGTVCVCVFARPGVCVFSW